MTEERLAQLEALCESVTIGPWAYDFGGMVVSPETTRSSTWKQVATVRTTHDDGKFIAEARTAVSELLAEVRRLRECLEFLADATKLSAEHHNSHLWAYIVGEALQVDPKESPFWKPDDEEVSP